MGREIRRVPPNWEHPKQKCSHHRQCNPDGMCYISMHDQDYKTAAKEWIDGLMRWERGEHEDGPDKHCKYYWEYFGNPPDEETCRPEFTEEPTWFQVYETVSEGTPVTPPFPTKEALAEYLSKHGDFWHQRTVRERAWEAGPLPTYESALRFVNDGHAFSMVAHRVGNDVTLTGPYDEDLTKA